MTVLAVFSRRVLDPLDRRSRRERVQLLIILGMLIAAGWHQWGWLPYTAALEHLAVEQRARQRGVALEARQQRLEARWQAASRGVAASGEIWPVLHRLLAAGTDVTLLALETAPPRPLVTCAGVAGGGIYRQELTLRLQGTFPGLLRTLDALESLPWRLHWQEMTLDAGHHPQVVMDLRLGILAQGPAPGDL